MLVKYSNIKFHENLSSGSRKFHADRQTDMTKITVAFRNFANASKHSAFCSRFIYMLRKLLTINSHYFPMENSSIIIEAKCVLCAARRQYLYYLPYDVFCKFSGFKCLIGIRKGGLSDWC